MPVSLFARLKSLLPRRRDAHAVAARARPSSAFTEQFRVLALNLTAMLKESNSKAVAVFSPFAGDGRTLTALHLSAALAEYTDVLLVDGTSRQSGQHEAALLKGASPGGPRAQRRQDLVPAGRRGVWLLPGNVAALGPDGELSPVVEESINSGMTVVIDSPPSRASADAFLLARKARHALYVVRNRHQDMGEHERVMQHLKRLDVEVLGVVLNDH